MTEFFNEPQEYKGVKFRSKFEVAFATFLDAFEIEWVYEKFLIDLPHGGHYLPDFYIPRQKLYVETRGHHDTASWLKLMEFIGVINEQTIKNEFLLITPDAALFFEDPRLFGVVGEQTAELAFCSSCKKFVFMGASGAYKCRACGAWDGDTLAHHSTNLHTILNKNSFNEAIYLLKLGQSWRVVG